MIISSAAILICSQYQHKTVDMNTPETVLIKLATRVLPTGNKGMIS